MKTRSKKGAKKVTNRVRLNKDLVLLAPLDKELNRMRKRVKKLKTSLEPTYWETASYAAIAVGGAVLVITAILISMLTLG